VANLKRIRAFGDQLVAQFDDGSRAVAVPTLGGVWYVRGGTSGSPPGGPGTVAAPSDDYPWPNATINTLSPLRFDYRECVDFVAWRLNRDAGVVTAPWKYDWGVIRGANGNGDAIGWRPDWQANGWPVDVPPTPGCVGWYGTSAGALGHVNYVQAVTGTTLVLEEYNWGGTHNYGKRTVTVGAAGAPDSYLSIPPR
jgi:surface antigen